MDVPSHAPLAGDVLAGVLVVRIGSPSLLAGLFLGICVWIVGVPAALVRAGRRVDRLAPAVAWTSAAILTLFGVWPLLDAVGTLR